MQDVLPDAQKLVSQPPFPSLPQAMVQLLAAKILTISVGEAQNFLLGNSLRPAAPATAPAASPSQRLGPAYAAPASASPTGLHASSVAEPLPPLFVLQRPKAGFRAEAQWLPAGTMRVLAGSTAAGSSSSSISATGYELRQHLLQTGVVRAHEGMLHFVQDYEFDSPNRAAEVVCGGSVNARISWLRATDSQTLGSYLANQTTN